VHDRVGKDVELRLGQCRVAVVDRLVYTGDDDGRVAGVFARSVDDVFVPGALGQTGGVQECTLGFAQCRVGLRERQVASPSKAKRLAARSAALKSSPSFFIPAWFSATPR
jgi:hypothetical protein